MRPNIRPVGNTFQNRVCGSHLLIDTRSTWVTANQPVSTVQVSIFKKYRYSCCFGIGDRTRDIKTSNFAASECRILEKLQCSILRRKRNRENVGLFLMKWCSNWFLILKKCCYRIHVDADCNPGFYKWGQVRIPLFKMNTLVVQYCKKPQFFVPWSRRAGTVPVLYLLIWSADKVIPSKAHLME